MHKIMKYIAMLILCLFCSSFAGPGLADGAAKFVGNITTNGQVRSDFGTYWNQITAENECKWASIEGRVQGQRDFTGCRNAYNWAKQNGGHFKFHALLWGSQYPSWLESLNTEQTKAAITNWFDAVQKEFPDLEMIDVVNEAIRTGTNSYHSNYPKTKIIEAMGGDNNGDYAFITNAFKMARERWPKAILIYNDYNTVQWNKDEGIQLIQTIKKNGAPIDGYGLQAHDMQNLGGGNNGTGGGGTCLALSTVKSVLSEIWEKTQTPIFITEYDIATDDDAIQKQCYQEQISYFMENEHVAGITIWGYIYGSTWTDNGNSGIIKNGNDRPAMTWLKEYLSKNKGANSTGLPTGLTANPEPQTPFKDTIAIPGKIEMENFDVPGIGTGNNSYYEGDATNHGDSDYRDGTGVDLYKKATGVVIGYQDVGEWYEYTINVKETGTYTMYAAVTAANEGGSFKLSIDGKDITDTIKVPASTSADTTYNDYEKVKTDVNLTAGKHILRYTVTGNWFDIDYITFVAQGEPDPEPIDKDTLITIDPPLDTGTVSIQTVTPIISMKTYHIFDINGKYITRVNDYSIEPIINMLKTNSLIKRGTYIIMQDYKTTIVTK